MLLDVVCLICSERLILCGWSLSFSLMVRDTNWEAEGRSSSSSPQPSDRKWTLARCGLTCLPLGPGGHVGSFRPLVPRHLLSSFFGFMLLPLLLCLVLARSLPLFVFLPLSVLLELDSLRLRRRKLSGVRCCSATCRWFSNSTGEWHLVAESKTQDSYVQSSSTHFSCTLGQFLARYHRFGS